MPNTNMPSVSNWEGVGTEAISAPCVIARARGHALGGLQLAAHLPGQILTSMPGAAWIWMVIETGLPSAWLHSGAARWPRPTHGQGSGAGR
jgi:hypothetical protein